jgi:hypothetical protein
MHRVCTAFDPTDMQAAVIEVDGIPAQRHDLGGAQAVAISD